MKEEELAKKKKLEKERRFQQNLQDMKEKKDAKVPPKSESQFAKPKLPVASSSQIPKPKPLVPFSSSDATVKITQPTVTCTPAVLQTNYFCIDNNRLNLRLTFPLIQHPHHKLTHRKL